MSGLSVHAPATKAAGGARRARDRIYVSCPGADSGGRNQEVPTVGGLGCVLVGLSLTGSGAGVAAEGRGRADPELAGPKSAMEQPALSRRGLDAFDLNIYGLSYHPDREAARSRNIDNETNPGLGIHYEWPEDIRGNYFVEAGAYLDSGENWAKFAALGYQLRVGRRWKVGAALAAIHSRTYNNGTAFVGMIPLVTWDLGRFKLNAVYFPQFGHYNRVDVLGFYISLPLGGLAR